MITGSRYNHQVVVTSCRCFRTGLVLFRGIISRLVGVFASGMFSAEPGNLAFSFQIFEWTCTGVNNYLKDMSTLVVCVGVTRKRRLPILVGEFRLLMTVSKSGSFQIFGFPQYRCLLVMAFRGRDQGSVRQINKRLLVHCKPLLVVSRSQL